MDPNAALAALRRHLHRLAAALGHDDRTQLVEAEIAHTAAHVLEHAEALDRWISRGGFLPDAWKKTNETEKYQEQEATT